MAKLSDSEFEAIVRAEIEHAVDYIDNDVAPIRAANISLYNGDHFDIDEDLASEGRSTVVSRDVHDKVQAILPQLMKIFFGSDKVVEYVPTEQGDVAFAQQATEYGNFILNNDNDGFQIFQTAFEDALVSRLGVVKVWFDEKETVSVQRVTGQPEDVLAALIEEGKEVEVTGEAMEMLDQVDPQTGMPVQVPVPFYDADIRHVKKEQRIKIAPVPPEEFIISRDARVGSQATLTGHKKMIPISELVEMGFDAEEVEQYAEDDDDSQDEERLARRSGKMYELANSSGNDAMRRVLYCETYIRVDYDGDGVAELRRIITLGSGYSVVENEPADYVPFALFPCDPKPHLSPVEGDSIPEKLEDVQRVKTEVLRNVLDSMAQTINPRTVTVEGQVEVDDLLNNQVGGNISVRSQDSIRFLETPYLAQQGFPVLEYFDSLAESRTGISQMSQGLNPDALKSVSTIAAGATVSASQMKIELIARNMAQGMKEVFRLMLRLMVNHQDAPRIIRLRNQFVPVDPRNWNPEMDVSVSVALGGGTQAEKMAVLTNVAQKQEMILQQLGPNNPICTLGQYANTLSKMVEMAGFADTSTYFNDLPLNFQLPPPEAPPVDPNTQLAELMAQVEREKAQAKLQIDQMKMQLESSKAEAKNQLDAEKIRLDREKAQAEEARKRLELEMLEAKFTAEMQIKEAEAVLKQLTTIQKLRQDDETRTQEEVEQGKEALRQESLLAQSIEALGSMIAQTNATTTQAMNAPKEVIRDQTGRIIGVRPVGE